VLSSDVILGTGNKEFFKDGGRISSGILTQDYNYTPCGSPIMASLTKSETIGCLTPFPARANTGCGIMWTPAHIIALTERKPLNETHKVRNIEEFDYSKFDSVIESVKTYSGISFLSKEKTSVPSILDSIKSIIGEYKYSSLFQFNIIGGMFLSGEDDNLLNILSFFDLSHCVPLFNLRKLDGLAISFSQVLRKHSELIGQQVNTIRLDIVVSNYEDNLFIIDGATIDQKYPIKSSLYKEVQKFVKKDLPIKQDKLKANLPKQDKHGRYAGIRIEPKQMEGMTVEMAEDLSVDVEESEPVEPTDGTLEFTVNSPEQAEPVEQMSGTIKFVSTPYANTFNSGSSTSNQS
jgi:hypothetical protein